MMKFKIRISAVAILAIVALTPNTVSAEKLDIANIAKPKKTEQPAKKPEKPEPLKPEITEHRVVKGESLTKIAKKHSTTIQRLWDKNTKLTDPDKIEVGDVLVVPLEGEKLKHRPMSAPVQVRTGRASTYPKGPVSGNTYDYGYCTWYVKNRRPDLPNNLGNADTWYYRATAQGLPTGTVPRVGAAAQTKGRMHVAYVEAVHGDGTITVSEMNVEGWNVVSSKRAPASNYWYIY